MKCMVLDARLILDTTMSPSFIKIGLETKKFRLEPVSGTFERALINNTVEVHGHCPIYAYV